METDNQQLEWRSQWGFNATNHDSMDWLKERQFQQKKFCAIKRGSLQGSAFENYLIPVFIHLEFIKAGVC